MIKIGQWEIESKDKARSICRGILYRLAKHQATEKDNAFIAALIELHPSSKQKIGVGVAWFEARPNFSGSLEFWLIRKDGTETDFSFHKCLDGNHERSNVLAALRHAIVDQVFEARDRAFAATPVLVSPFTGEEITAATCEMDHWPPFATIADRFILMVGGWDKIATTSVDGQRGCAIADAALRHKWQEFHRRNATLRAVSKEENRTIIPQINRLMTLDDERRERDRIKHRGYDVNCSHEEHKAYLQRNNLTCPCLFKGNR